MRPGFHAILLYNVLTPLSVPLAYLGMWGIGRLVKRPLDVDKVINVIGEVGKTLMTSITALALSLFAGSEMPNGRTMLKDFPSVEMLSEEWVHALPIGIAATLLYCVAVLAQVMRVVVLAPKAVSNDPAFATRYGFVFGDTRALCWWWIILQLFFSVALNAAQVFAVGVQHQLLLTFVVVVCFGCIQSYVRPLKFRVNNVVEDINSFAYVLVLVFATTMVQGDEVSDEAKLLKIRMGYTAVCVLVVTLAALAAVVVIVRCWWHKVSPPGTDLAYTLHHAFEFRHLTMLLNAMPNKEFMKVMSQIDDHDLNRLQVATHSIISGIFMEQPSPHIWNQRMIPDAKFTIWSHGEAFDRLERLDMSEVRRVMQRNRTEIREMRQFRTNLESLVRSDKSGLHTVDLVADMLAQAHSEASIGSLDRQSSLHVQRFRKWFSHRVQHRHVNLATDHLIAAISRLMPETPLSEVTELCGLMDLDSSHDLTLEEFTAALFGMTETKDLDSPLDGSAGDGRASDTDLANGNLTL